MDNNVESITGRFIYWDLADRWMANWHVDIEEVVKKCNESIIPIQMASNKTSK